MALAILLTAYHTYPVAFRLGQVSRLDSGDGQWCVWVVNWVAHALLTDPANLFNANIFAPHRGALAFSEPNIGAGVLAIPAYLATRNPVAAHNSVAVASFALAFLAAYGLTRYLTGSRSAGVVAGIGFGFSPYAFARTAEIHLMLSAGIPLSLLAMHRFVDRRSMGRAAALGGALFLQAISCGYYGIFAGLAVGLGVVFFALTRGLWREGRYWLGVGLAALISAVLVSPLFVPLVQLRQATGFGRSLQESVVYSADWRAYLASSAWAHRWMLPWLGHWNEVLFPGFLTTMLGLAGLGVGLRAADRQVRDVTGFYVLLGGLALWASFGPGAGLYTALFHTIPLMVFLRAPGRLGILVVLCLATLAGIGLAEWRRRNQHTWRPVVIAVAMLLAAELTTMPLRWYHAWTSTDIHTMLAELPPGAVAEFPFYAEPHEWYRHGRYMVMSTFHWHPLLNGYSDYIPADFRKIAGPVSRFPTQEAFRILQERQVRYLVFHLLLYSGRRGELLNALKTYDAYLRPIRLDEHLLLYEIAAWPDTRVARPVGPP